VFMVKPMSRRAAIFTTASLAPAQTSASDLDRVKVGAAAPAFELPSASGGKLSLESLKGKNTVLVFYRGYW